MRTFGSFAQACSLLGFGTLAAGQSQRPNVLLVVADDVGVDLIPAYGEYNDPPITPTIDALAHEGMLFRNAYSNPLCSPTRATILTGRYALRTGIGVNIFENTAALKLSEVTIPELLDNGNSGFSHSCFGKWHLGNATVGGNLAPNLAGFSHYDGCLLGLLAPPPINYFAWPRDVDGVVSTCTVYATTQVVDSALAWIQQAPEPWFCSLNFNAANYPLHAPPAGLCYEDLTGLDPSMTPRPFTKAMVEAMDTELGRLFANLGSILDNTMVIFVGDNGTQNNSLAPPLGPSNHGKGSLYEGGINVPWIVKGPGVVAGSVCDALVNTTDLFRTIAEIAGVDPDAVIPEVTLDSVTTVPYFADPGRAPLRRWVFSEWTEPVGATGSQITYAARAMRDERYKLILQGRAGLAYELYDLWNDPYEQHNLLSHAPLSPSAQASFVFLRSKMNSITSRGPHVPHLGPANLSPRPATIGAN